MIIKQENIDYNKHCKYGFGAYVQAFEDNDPNINSMKARTIDAIYLGPIENYQGGHLVLNINTWKPIRRAKIWQVPVTETIRKIIEAKAKQDDVTSFKFLNRNKVDVDVDSWLAGVDNIQNENNIQKKMKMKNK